MRGSWLRETIKKESQLFLLRKPGAPVREFLHQPAACYCLGFVSRFRRPQAPCRIPDEPFRNLGNAAPARRKQAPPRPPASCHLVSYGKAVTVGAVPAALLCLGASQLVSGAANCSAL